jgi:hypothetical protein
LLETGFAGRKNFIAVARFEVLTAVTVNNAVFWDIENRSLPHRKHYISVTEPSRLMLCKI